MKPLKSFKSFNQIGPSSSSSRTWTLRRLSSGTVVVVVDGRRRRRRLRRRRRRRRGRRRLQDKSAKRPQQALEVPRERPQAELCWHGFPHPFGSSRLRPRTSCAFGPVQSKKVSLQRPPGEPPRGLLGSLPGASWGGL